MSKTSRTHRGDLMRRIAAMYAKMSAPRRGSKSPAQTVAQRQELQKQIAALKEQMMAP